jgi:hypothetical protein
MEHIQGVRGDMYLAYILQPDIVSLMDPICDCLQFGVVIEVPLTPEVESHD